MRILIEVDFGLVVAEDIDEAMDVLNNLMGRRDGVDDHDISWELLT